MCLLVVLLNANKVWFTIASSSLTLFISVHLTVQASVPDAHREEEWPGKHTGKMYWEVLLEVKTMFIPKDKTCVWTNPVSNDQLCFRCLLSLLIRTLVPGCLQIKMGADQPEVLPYALNKFFVVWETLGCTWSEWRPAESLCFIPNWSLCNIVNQLLTSLIWTII